MKLNLFFLIFVLQIFGSSPTSDLFTAYRSEGLEELALDQLEGEFYFIDDYGEQTQIEALVDSEGLFYWHRKIMTPVCQTGECKAVHVGLYWYPSGAFLGLEVYDEPLTKTDHSVFQEDDYKRLIDVLSSDRSILGEYAYDDLLGTSSGAVDGITGATRQDIAAVAVENAVYTTFTLWHLTYDGEGTQFRNLTADLLNSNIELPKNFVESEDVRFHFLILELLGQGKLMSTTILDEFAVQSLRKNKDPYLKRLAIKAISNLDFEDTVFQGTLARYYSEFTEQERVQILTAMSSEIQVDNVLLEALIQGAIDGGDWLAATTLETLENDPTDDPRLRAIALILAGNEKSFLRDPAEAYLGGR